MDLLQQLQRSFFNPGHSNLYKAAPEITKSKHFYFEDGNIVLVAGNVAFRVYRGFLTRHSAVFREFLSVMDQSTYAGTFDGCPAVRLPETCRDVTVFLRSLHGEIQLSLEGSHLLVCVLRMATKYLVDPLRDFCIKSLRKVYPDDLVKWDEYNGESRASLAVIQSIDVDILRPAAFYRLCSNRSSFHLLNPELPPHLLEVYCRGKEFMGAVFANLISSRISFYQPPVCATSGHCCLSWIGFELMALDYLRNPLVIASPDPLKWLRELLVKEAQLSLCDHCHRRLRKSIKEARSRIWESLPVVFGLGSWKELRERHNRDFGAL